MICKMMEEDQDNAKQEVLEIDVKSLDCSVQLTCSVVLIVPSLRKGFLEPIQKVFSFLLMTKKTLWV